MPYITKELVKEIRQDLKKTFPDFKFSITRNHHSEVRIVILEGTIDFGSDNASVNHFWIEEHYKNNPIAKNFLCLLRDFAKKDQRVLVEDGDYGTVPTYYISLRIGEWDKPYKLKK
jgi:hypothetical protein